MATTEATEQTTNRRSPNPTFQPVLAVQLSGRDVIFPIVYQDLRGGMNIPEEIYILLRAGSMISHTTVDHRDNLPTTIEHWSAEEDLTGGATLVLQTTVVNHATQLSVNNHHLLTSAVIRTSYFFPVNTWKDVKILEERPLLSTTIHPSLADIPMKSWVTKVEYNVRSTD